MCICLSVCKCTLCIQKPEDGIKLSQRRALGSYEPMFGYGVLNLGPFATATNALNCSSISPAPMQI